MPLSNTFRRVKPPSGPATRAITLATFVERKDTGPMNVQTRLASQQSLTQTLPSPTGTLWDLQDVLEMEIHAGTMDTAKKDEENSKQTSKVGKIFLPWAPSQPRL